MSRNVRIRLLAAVVDAHLGDPRRSEAISRLTRLTLERMGLSKPTVVRGAEAAMICDIGLIDSSSKKSEAARRSIYQLHPERSATILAEMGSFEDLLAIIRCHHARPTIDAPIESFVICACEAYCDAVGIRGGFLARDVLRCGMGVEFKAEVVEHVLAVLRSTSGEEREDRIATAGPIS